MKQLLKAIRETLRVRWTTQLSKLEAHKWALETQGCEKTFDHAMVEVAIEITHLKLALIGY